MTLVIPPGFAEVSVEFKADGDPSPWYITFGVESPDGGFGGSGPLAVTSAVRDWIVPAMPPFVTFTGVNIKVGQDGGPPLTVRRNTDDPGIDADSARLPQNCALLVHKTTGRGGRTGRGRMYLPAVLPENKVDNIGNIDGTYLLSIQGNIDSFLDALSTPEPGAGEASPMVLLHNAGVPGGTTPTPVQTLQCDQVIATQRRRLR